MFQNNNLECVSNYRYLGVYFTASGSFNQMRTEIYNKGLKAYYKLRRDFLSLSPNIHSCLHVFDHTIKPIILYNSEIWGSYCASNAKLRTTFDVDNIFKNVQCEKLHIKFSKFILGVHKKSVNFAVLSELGRFPLYYDIVKSIIRYWYRLENLSPEFMLLKDAYMCSKKLHNEKRYTWYTFVEKLLQFLDLKHENNKLSKYKFKNILDKQLRMKLLNNWYHHKDCNKDGKLRTYFKIKDHFGFENYLTLVKNFDQRKAISSFRISAHRLQIELGRFSNTPLSERICKNRSLNLVEDEIHFLCRCPKYDNVRKELFKLVGDKFPNFLHLSDESKLIFLFSNEDTQILCATAKLLIYK